LNLFFYRLIEKEVFSFLRVYIFKALLNTCYKIESFVKDFLEGKMNLNE